MTPSEVSALLVFANAIDPRTPSNDLAVKAWAEFLDAEMPLEFAQDVLRRHVRSSDKPVTISVFVQAWQSQVQAEARVQATDRMLGGREDVREMSPEVRAALHEARSRLGGGKKFAGD